MALMPQATYRPINYSGVPRMRSSGPNVLIFHTIVGHDPANAAHFSTGGNGELTQSRDTIYQSAASLEANPRSLAVETEDMGAPFPSWGGSDVPAWTEPQINRHVEICVWAYQVHHIPLQLAADSKTGSAGIAYHRQGIDGNWAGYAYGGRVSGGEHWSSSTGKVCPGDRRIKQLIEIVIPRARKAAGLEPDMELNEPSWVPIPGSNPVRYYANGEIQYWDNYYANEISQMVHEQQKTLKALADQGAANAAAIAALTQKVVEGETADITMAQMEELLKQSVVHVEIKPMTPPDEVMKQARAIRLDKERAIEEGGK
jgi:hypothetical protein